MAVEVTIFNVLPGIPSDIGWRVEYRIKGTLGVYITPVGSPFTTLPIVFTATDSIGTLYEGHIWNDCGDGLISTKFDWETPCDCEDVDYSPSLNGMQCEKIMTTGATITHSGYCLVKTSNGAYSNYGSRIYTAGFTLSDILLSPATPSAHIYGSMAYNPQWANPGGDTISGPMNREAVWIDSDCDGNKDLLTMGVSTTISAQFNNISGARTIYVGIGADNQFKVVVNGSVVIDTLSTASSNQFKIFHIIPIIIRSGINYVNLVAIGDGTINDAMAMVIYDNSASQIQAATSDAALDLIFKSSVLDGTTYDTATCPSSYSLDTSEGSGAYICTKTLIQSCNTSP